MGRWGAGAGGLGRHGGRGVGQNDEGDEGVRFPSSPWAEVARGGAPTTAGGGGRWRLWLWRCEAEEGARGGDGGFGGGGLHGGPIYRRGEAVEGRGQR